MRNYILRFVQVMVLLSPLNFAFSNPNLNVLLRGNYAFTGVYNCLQTFSGGFNANGQPVNPEFSQISNIPISGIMNFDGAGNYTQNGRFVETVSPASTANTTSIPGIGSGTFTVESSAYTVAKNRGVTVNVGVTNITGLTGNDANIALVVTPDNPNSSELSGQLSKNRSLVLTTAVPLFQTASVFINGNNVATFPRICSVTMTLIPSN